eukprot:TRINITY_DN16468_c0_g1_i1.p1 TRINITY_DN16468_c0_g1~~TRINITY_DN16468_c0_g1_i1.p1  ORF type:complete len:209 (-),score=65.83 TRINITY_DN16468_c0_g1_i1:49-675(-)
MRRAVRVLLHLAMCHVVRSLRLADDHAWSAKEWEEEMKKQNKTLRKKYRGLDYFEAEEEEYWAKTLAEHEADAALADKEFRDTIELIMESDLEMSHIEDTMSEKTGKKKFFMWKAETNRMKALAVRETALADLSEAEAQKARAVYHYYEKLRDIQASKAQEYKQKVEEYTNDKQRKIEYQLDYAKHLREKQEKRKKQGMFGRMINDFF